MRILATAVVLVSLGSNAWAEGYGMKDLKALEQQQGWQELFEHLGDIVPSKRDATWQALADKSASGYLEGIKIEERRGRQAIELSDEMVKKFPTLKKSKSFMAKRAEVGLKVFQASFGDSRHSSGDDPWRDQLLEFVESDSSTADLPLRAGKLVMTRLIAEVAFPFYKLAVQRQGAQVCKDGEVRKSVIEALGDGVWLKELTELVHKRCWNELKDPLVAALKESKEKGYPKHACPLLKAKGLNPPVCAALK